MPNLTSLLNNPVVRQALRTAWLDSNPGVIGGHEEGVFVVRDPSGILSVVRWLRGEMNSINLPSHFECKVGENQIVASFHTHPNTGFDFLQEPSQTDILAVLNDPNLKGTSYEGEFVVSNEWIYRIAPNGVVTEIATTSQLFDSE